MDLETALADVKSLEHQLAVLKAELQQLSQPKRSRTFADLYGIWAGQSETTEDDMRAVQYGFEWDDAE